VANVLRGLLPVLDAVARARELGAVHGGFQQVAQTLETELAALGLEAFGEAGEPFDPARHEALSHTRSTEVDHATCSKVLAPGYRVGDQLLRPAQGMVTESPAPTGDRWQTALRRASILRCGLLRVGIRAEGSGLHQRAERARNQKGQHHAPVVELALLVVELRQPAVGGDGFVEAFGLSQVMPEFPEDPDLAGHRVNDHPGVLGVGNGLTWTCGGV
jgi:hypothetical protein